MDELSSSSSSTKVYGSATDASFAMDIVPDGNIVLHVKEVKSGFDQRYRCSREALRENSAYLNALLDPDKFVEGIDIEAKLKELGEQYNSSQIIPSEVLPTVAVQEIVQFSASMLTLESVMHIFLQILHGILPEWPLVRKESIQHLAHLVLIADNLSALAIIRVFVCRSSLRRLVSIPNNITESISSSQKRELSIRQQLLVGLLLDIPDWVRDSSAYLIVEGSERWLRDPASGAGNDLDDVPAWYMLPRGVEGITPLHIKCPQS